MLLAVTKLVEVEGAPFPHLDEQQKVDTPAAVRRLFAPLAELSRPECWAVGLSDERRARVSWQVSLGVNGELIFQARDVLGTALRLGASSIVLGANLPEVSDLRATPSLLRATRLVVLAGRILGVALHDFAILCPSSSLSMRASTDGTPLSPWRCMEDEAHLLGVSHDALCPP